jgi:cysteine desulfuration protein SufE
VPQLATKGPVIPMQTTVESLRDDFAILDDWEDRYRHVIELGRALPEMNAALKTASTKVNGCASQVWIHAQAQKQNDVTTLHMVGDSDALIVKGLIAIVFAMYNNKPVNEILQIDANGIFAELGLAEHLTPQRSNGLASMVARIRQEAQSLQTMESLA